MVSKEQIDRALWIVEREDYLPWADVAAAKELLGIKETDPDVHQLIGAKTPLTSDSFNPGATHAPTLHK